MFTTRDEHYSFAADFSARGFLLSVEVADLSAPMKGEEEIICAENDALTIYRRRFPQIAHQHYPAGAMAIEATLKLRPLPNRPDWKEISVGFPIAADDHSKHTIFIYTDFVRLHLVLDDKLMDENFIYGDLDLPDQHIAEKVRVEERTAEGDAQYFSPAHFNAWVGDVVPFYHDGTLHVFYLYDRRHHNSKFGTGAHYFAHLTTKNLVDWREEENATRLSEQWMTDGTGVPFFHRGKYYFCHGLHTGRFTDTAGSGDELANAAPSPLPRGATYSESDDGIHFSPTGKIVAPCENPSVYPQADGSLLMYANGIYRAENVDGPWECVKPYIANPTSPVFHTLECPSHFEWYGKHYLIIGKTGFFAADNPLFNNAEDLAVQGRDIYDGLAVPMVCEWKDNRRIIAGWVWPFGTYLVMRELIMRESGELGTRWLPEKSAAKTFSAHGSIEIEFCGEILPPREVGTPTGAGCLLRINCEAAEIQTLGDTAKLRTLREYAADSIDYSDMVIRNRDRLHFMSHDFKIERLDLPEDFEVKVIMNFDPKFPATIIDVEIGGVRTMVSLRTNIRIDTARVF